ncbi:MAG: class I SAM-dependent methyltransferase [Candidatus Lokiarchaeota archaeon]|nr:class I SAM-dependent methyltransferase [Candidatus Lokiarchaeota archaeon]
MDKNFPSGEDKVSIVAKETLKFLKKKLIKSNRYTLLDIGCGNGRDIKFLSSNLDNLIVHGIDSSLKAVENAKRLNKTQENIKIERMDWKDLDDTQYDIIFISGVYHFFPITERKSFILKIRKILKANGFFILSTLSSSDRQYYGKGNPVKGDINSFQSEYFIHFSSEEELKKDFHFLTLINQFEFFHKNYSKDLKYHTMWMLIGQN